MRLLRCGVAALFLLGVFPPDAFTPDVQAQGAAVNVSREQGWALFREGKYQQAREIFRSFLKHRPQDESARLGLARALYHLEDWQDALESFRGVSLGTLDPEASYEYGLTMFRSKYHHEALTAFRRVPRGHSLHDLAAYHAGQSAMRLGRYQDAVELFEAAVRLPEPQRGSRDMYARHAQDMVRRRERRRLASEFDDENGSLPKLEGYRHAGIYYIDKDAVIGTENKRQVARYHDVREETNHFSTRYFHFENGLIHPLSAAGERRSAIGTLVELDAEQKDFDGLERTLDRAPDVTARTTEFSKTGRWSALLFSEWALPQAYWLNAEVAFEQEYPDFGKRLSYSTRSGGVGIGQRKDGYQARLMARILETLDATRNVTMTEARYGLETFAVPWHYLEIFAQAQYSTFEYQKGGIDGPRGRARFDGEAKFYLPLAISFLLQARFERHAGHAMHLGAGGPPITYGKDAARGVAMLYFEPLTWIRIGGRVEEERQWLSRVNPIEGAGVHAVEPSRVFETALFGELNLFF